MTDFYIAPDGRDDHSGTDAHPFGTLDRARDAARAASAAGPHRIMLRGGDYHAASMALTPEDSGLTIECAPGERPVLLGGRKVTGWLADESQLWSVDLPEVREGSWDFRHIYVNGGHRRPSRFPERGVLRHLSRFDVKWLSTTDGGWERKPTEEERTTLIYRPGDIPAWPDILSAEIQVFHQWDDSIVGVKSVDDAAHTITFSNPAGHPPGAFHYFANPKAECYIIWNVRAGLTRPGQWCVDREAGKLYYWPLPGEDLASIEVIIPLGESVIRLSGEEESLLRDVTIRGLTISGTTTPLKSAGFAAGRMDGAISGAFLEGCKLEGLHIAEVGGHGMRFARCSNLEITGCEISSAGAGGICCHRSDGVLITRNHVHDTGLTYPSAEGMYVTGRDFKIANNLFHDITYTAIGGGASDSAYESNFFYNIMTVLDDGASIYTTFCRNILVRDNVAVGTSGGIAHAYYLDEQTDDSVVEKNLALNTGWPTHNHWAHRNVLRNNFFIDEIPCNPNQDDGPMLLSFPRCEEFTLERNVFSAPTGIRLSALEGWLSAAPDNIFSPGTGTVDFEVAWSGEPSVPWEMRDGSVRTDPALAHADYRTIGFVPGSPASELGIEPIDTTNAGISGWPTFSTVRTTLRLLDHAKGTAKLKLEVMNLGNAEASGQALLWCSPSGSAGFKEGDTFTYELGPMEHKSWEVNAELKGDDIMLGYQDPDGLGLFKGAIMLHPKAPANS